MVWHCGPAQLKPLHDTGCDPWQFPLPSQVFPAMALPFVHDAFPQEVPGGVSSQTPPGAQLPSLPQGGFEPHSCRGSAVVAMASEQVPFAPMLKALEHAWQAELQAESQQKPSTQWPFKH